VDRLGGVNVLEGSIPELFGRPVYRCVRSVASYSRLGLGSCPCIHQLVIDFWILELVVAGALQKIDLDLDNLVSINNYLSLYLHYNYHTTHTLKELAIDTVCKGK
jgi:hypothetical protein